MSFERAARMIEPHQIGQLNVHLVKSIVESAWIELVRQSEIMQTPRSSPQDEEIRLRSADGAAEHVIGSERLLRENGAEHVAAQFDARPRAAEHVAPEL